MPGSSSSSNPTLTYKIVSWILFPAALFYTIAIAVRQKNLPYFAQRLGFYNFKPGRPIWCHCASVGEIKTALPLLNNLLDHNEQLIVSTNTTTGLKVLLQANLKDTTALYLPLDYSYFAKKFIAAYSPKYCLILETELWPNILLTTIKHSIPIVIINGRISEKTLKAPNFIKNNYAKILKNVTHIFASSEINFQRYKELGADTNIISKLDNLKFSSITKKDFHSNPLKQKFILCASTHDNEEFQILREWKKHSWDNIQLVIAIRHPQRKNQICKILEDLSLNYVLHSEKPSGKQKDNIYIIDIVGELTPFIQHAELVFMGGSLIPSVGGHNILEAAQYGKCILNGPYYENFSDIIDEMKQNDSIIVVKNIEDLMAQIIQLISNKEKRIQIGSNAKIFFDKKSNIGDKYSEIILKLIRAHSS